ncbi:hypothetical protein [Pararhodobacter oceanensis]|uniref:hypothetical protein n=1 Tax=Pararhodobacter oceanensis TaxID=2172121 RepID=UPI003A92083E
MLELSRRDFPRTAPSKAVVPHVIPPRGAPADLHRTPHPQPPNRQRNRGIRFHQHNLPKITGNKTFAIDTCAHDLRDCPERPSHAPMPRTDRRIERTNAPLPPFCPRDADPQRHGNTPL